MFVIPAYVLDVRTDVRLPYSPGARNMKAVRYPPMETSVVLVSDTVNVPTSPPKYTYSKEPVNAASPSVLRAVLLSMVTISALEGAVTASASTETGSAQARTEATKHSM
jgi:hypothetical protein